MRLIFLPLLALAACGAPTNPPLVSAQYPPAAMSENSLPQSLNSMPPGTANLSRSPNATAPNYLSLKLPAF